MLKGLNHITLSVSNLETSFRFYTEILGFTPKAKWNRGAYLELVDLWLCLSLDDSTRTGPSDEYTHIAFSTFSEDFESVCSRVQNSGTETWQENKSEGSSLYILDPDGHKLEIHVGTLSSRLESLKTEPYDGLTLFE